ncbi:MAG: sulfatase-like hydrolase/transferase [Rubripirellula sp.]
MRSLILILLTLVLNIESTDADSAALPNVVLILSDDQGYTDYGFMGHPQIETPNLDELARESALFRQGYVHNLDTLFYSVSLNCLELGCLSLGLLSLGYVPRSLVDTTFPK